MFYLANKLLAGTLLGFVALASCTKSLNKLSNPRANSGETKTSKELSVAVTGLPEPVSNSNFLNLEVSGEGVEKFYYNLKTASTECPTEPLDRTGLKGPEPAGKKTVVPLTKDGIYTLCIVGTNNAETAFGFVKKTWEKDGVPPEVTLVGTPSNPSANATLDVTVQSSTATHFKYALVSSTSCVAAVYSDWIEKTQKINSSTGGDGQKTLCVLGKDLAGNVPVNPVSYSWAKQSTPSTAALSNVPAASSNETALNVTVGGTDVSLYKFSLVTSGSCASSTYSASWTSVSTPITSSLGADGSYKLCVVGKSTLGVEQSSSSATEASWTKDTVAPTSSDISLTNIPAIESQAASLSVTVGGTGVVSYKSVFKDAGTACVSQDFDAVSWKAVSDSIDDAIGADGSKRLCVLGKDAAGNITDVSSPKEFTWTKDTVAPLNTDITLSGTPSSQSSDAALNVTVTGAGVVDYKSVLKENGAACDPSDFDSVTWKQGSETITSSIGADGSKRLCVIARDLAGNITDATNPKEYSWTKDAVGPTNSDITLSGVPGAESQDSALNVSVSGTGVLEYKVVLKAGGEACDPNDFTSASWTDISEGIDDAIGADGSKRLCVIAKDAAGNFTDTSSPKEYAWIKDTEKPDANDITLTGTPADPSNGTGNLNVGVSATGFVSYKYSYTTSSESCATATYSASWVAVSTAITDAIGVDADKKRLCVIARDSAGNEMDANVDTPKSYDWKQDTVAPVALLTSVPSATTNPLAVSVTGDDVYEYQYALTTPSTSCASATYNGTWIGAATPISDVPANGDNRLCVLARDEARNEQTHWDGLGAARFDDANGEKLSHSDSSSIEVGGDNDFTYSAWVYFDDKFAYDTLISKNGGNGDYSFDLVAITSPNFLLSFRVSNDGSVTNYLNGTTIGALENGQWYHVVIWHNSATDEIGIRVNDNAEDTKSHTGGLFDSLSSLTFGASSTGSNLLDGRLSKIGFWKNHVLSSSEITELYNSGKGKRYSELSTGLKSDLVSYWDLTEASGTRFDSHGANHLTDNNTVTQGVGPGEATILDWIHDATPPTFSAFELQDKTTNSTTFSNAPVVRAVFTATDNDVAYYCASTVLNTEPSIENSCWTTTQPVDVTVTNGQTVYGWVRDRAGNLASAGRTSSITMSNPCASGSMDDTTCTVSSDLGTLANNDNTTFEGSANIVLASGANFTTNPLESISISTSGSFTVNAGVTINANISNLSASSVVITGSLTADGLGEQGTTSGNGPGAGGGPAGTTNVGSVGGSHGGKGGIAQTGYTPAGAYGSTSEPTSFGSAGGSSNPQRGGHGGGVIKIVATSSVSVAGTLAARGGSGTHNSGSEATGGGAGGSVWVVTASLSGAGTISAVGGDGANSGTVFGGGGGGGRIALDVTSSTFSGTASVAGGSGPSTADDGDVGILYQSIDSFCNSGSWDTTCTISSNKGALTNGTTLGGSGSLVIASNGVVASNLLQKIGFALNGDVTINAGGSIAANLSDLVAANLTIHSGGTVTANGLGYQGSDTLAGTGPAGGAAGTSSNRGGAGGGHAGKGGNGNVGDLGGSALYGSLTNPVTFGSSGGSDGYSGHKIGGHGGGAIKISVAGNVTVNGILSANGLIPNSSAGPSLAAGGGAGGSVWLSTGTLSGNGTISAIGGNGNDETADGGGGGGGRISIESAGQFLGSFSVAGGSGPGAATDGESGTIYFASTNHYCASGSMVTTCTVESKFPIENSSTFVSAGNIVIASGGGLFTKVNESASIDIAGDLTIQSGGEIRGNFTSIEAENITIDVGGVITADGFGEQGNDTDAGTGTGGGAVGVSASNKGGGGGAHGGAGGEGSGAIAGGLAYGSPTAPVTKGSAGGSDGYAGYHLGGNGGGVIKVVAATSLTLNGTITANGLQPHSLATAPSVAAGGGAGGSVWVVTNSIYGNGTITANGGIGIDATADGGGGGGGRVALQYSNGYFLGTKLARGGTGVDTASDGKVGSICVNGTGLLCDDVVKQHLDFWISADQGVNKDQSDNVTSWYDQSGNERHVTDLVGTSHWEPNSLNGNPIVQTTTNSSFRQVAGVTAVELFLVVKVSSATGTRYLLDFRPGTSHYLGQNIGFTGFASMFVNGSSSTLSTPNLYNDAFQIVRLKRSNAVTASQFSFGGRYDGNEKVTSDFAEIAAFSSELSQTQRQKVEAYLANKYNIPIMPTSNQKLWLRADKDLFTSTDCVTTAATTDNAAIGCWKDQSSNANHALKQAYASPVLKTQAKNGRNVVEFNSTSLTRLDFNSEIELGNTFSSYLVTHPTKGTLLNGTGNNYVGYFPNDLLSVWMRNGVPAPSVSFSTAISDWILATFFQENNRIGEVNARGKNSVSSTLGYDLDTLKLSHTHAGFDGQVSEIALYSERHDEKTKQQIDLYLSDKYGLSYETSPVLDNPGLKLWLKADNGLTTSDGAAKFVAANTEYLSIADNAALSTGDVDFSIAGWIKVSATSSGLQTLVSKYDGGLGLEYALFYAGNGGFQFSVWPNSVTLAPSTPMQANKWYFVAAYHDAANNQIGISINGSPFTTAAATPPTDGGAPVVIGGVSGGNYLLDGSAAKVGFWKNYVLTPTDVSSLYYSGLGREYSAAAPKANMVAYWELDETSGTRNDSHGTYHLSDNNTVTGDIGPGLKVREWRDQSGEGNHANQTDPSKMPQFVVSGGAGVNNRPVLRFDGSGKGLTLNSKTSGNKATVFYVAKNNDGTNGSMVLSENGTAGSNYFFMTSGGQTRFYPSTTTASTSATGTAGVFFIGSAWLDGTNNVAFRDGNPGTTQASSGNFQVDTIGQFNSNANLHMDGDIAEIIIYNQVLSTSQRQAVECYLGSKYNVVVTGHACP